MATRISHLINAALPELRYEPTAKRVRASLGGAPVLDSVSAVLLWEPRPVVPIYAVPESDVLAQLSVSTAIVPAGPVEAKVLTPEDAFALHTTKGTVLDVEVAGRTLSAAAFRLSDPGLPGIVAFDFRSFDWLEEDGPIDAHPRDPFKRVDILASSRHVRVELEGMLLAESRHPRMLFETHVPARYYVQPSEVAWDALVATNSSSKCPYKGTANYWAPASGGRDVAWSYANPLPEAAAIAGLLCFYNERTDYIVDGHRLPRPQTPFG
ncbi:DUF427 domain-containing protein [Arthrobacter sp. AQ5-05]|uniref:DUF427 domain-containing protein n=1 Tax=Arthrobacter sp. AQ5-05 TaxID=2184581 RepID=UPI001C65F372|nr:DUF427 domain-containing protein [Arthrobacter sp. AQ5-05]